MGQPIRELPRGRMVSLDGLRGVAAIMVMLFHLGLWMHINLLPNAYLSVDFFFMLSGFVVSQAYFRQISTGSWRSFLWRRLVRLWPMMAVGVILGSVIRLHYGMGFGVLALAFPLALMAVPNIFAGPAALFALNPPEWSLSCELLANITHGALRFGAAWIGIVVVAFLMLLVADLRFGTLAFGNALYSFPLGIVSAVFAYGAGIGLQRVRVSFMLPFPISGALLVGGIAAPKVIPGQEMIILTALFPLLIAGASNARSDGFARSLTVLGALSYPLYMTHEPVIMAVAKLSQKYHLGFGTVFSLAIATTILVAATAWLLIDRRATTRQHLLLGPTKVSEAEMPYLGA